MDRPLEEAGDAATSRIASTDETGVTVAAPGETWDVGTLQLTVGGTLVVHDDEAANLGYLVRRDDERFVCGLVGPERPLRSEPLAPGRYRLHVRSPSSAAQVLPFTIDSGRETVLPVTPVPGVLRRIEITAGPTADARIAFDVRKDGRQVDHVMAQLRAALDGVTRDQAASIVIAYEPIWAIGTGEVATPEDAQEVCAAIRNLLAELYSGDLADGVRILYGGSVKAANVAAIMAQDDVDGALVGGASIDPEEFASICRYRDHVTAT